MKNFSFLALIATVMCLVACGPKETKTPIEGTSDYVLFSKSDVPGKYGIKDAQGLPIVPNVYSQITYSAGHFIGLLDGKYLLLTSENKLAFRSSTPISYNAELECFETKEGKQITLYFPKENGKISGVFEAYALDHNGNILVKENGKDGVYTKAGQKLIPIENEAIIVDDGNYIVLNSKNAKYPIWDNDKNTIINRRYVKITAFDKEGKKMKAPSLIQVEYLLKLYNE